MKIYKIIFLLLAFNSQNVMAHSEHDKARFVAPEGTDTGKCDNPLRPCSSIEYAVNQANKGDKILVAAGKYNIKNNDELFYLKSALVPVLGGYNRFDHFQSQSPDTNITVLAGIPVELASDLRQSGFTVITDGKSIKQDKKLQNKFQNKFQQYVQQKTSQNNLTCINKLAGPYACENIDLLSHVPLSELSTSPRGANDIWGHVDLNTGKEYAIMGIQNGVTVFDVTDPSAPSEVGTIEGKDSSWRDVKVYQYFDKTSNLWQAYAYSTMDVDGIEYVTIIDLNHLPNSISLVERNQAVSMAHNVYISNVDHTLNIALAGETPTLQLVGSNKFSGAFNSYSLANPRTLSLITQSGSSGAGYTHDGSSLTITDERKDRDCQVTGDSCTVFIDFNEKEMKLWNITDPANAKSLGVAQYFDVDKSSQYVHSGWGSEDKQYIFLHDEFDETRGGLNTTVRVFSIDNLKSPNQVGQWTGPTGAIDHNGFVRGNRYYMSNYQRGLTVLDITDPTTPVEIGLFDTYTPSDGSNFSGAWGTYPFLPSGNILISDINSGLFIVKDNTLVTPQGTLSFESKQVNAEQGSNLNVNVSRLNTQDTATSVSVSYEIIPGSALPTEDYTPTSGTLTWNDNNQDDQTITIMIEPSLSTSEFTESFYIRLFDPKSGATLSSPSYLTVNIEGVVDTGAISLTQNSMTVSESQSSLVIPVGRSGNSSGELSIEYHLTGLTAELDVDIENSSGILTWQDGDNSNKEILLNIINDEIVEQNETALVTLTPLNETKIGLHNQLTITIADDESNTPPIVNISENFEANTNQTISLIATASDTEDNPLTFSWSQVSGSSVNLSVITEGTTTFIAPTTAGVLTLNVTVTDFHGAQTTKEVSITVVAAKTQEIKPNNNGGSGGSFTQYTLFLLLLITFKKLLRIKQTT